MATAVDGTPEVVLHGRTGILVSPGDVTGLATAVGQLFANPDEGRRLGKAGRNHVTEHFDQRQQVRDTGVLVVGGRVHRLGFGLAVVRPLVLDVEDREHHTLGIA